MPKKTKYARVAITLPTDDLASADRLARQQARSRSWIIAEAIRRYASLSSTAARSAGVDARDSAAGLGASRRAQLIADLSLTPEERVRAAEETARVSFLRRPMVAKRVLAFDRYEDYLEWKRREAIGG